MREDEEAGYWMGLAVCAGLLAGLIVAVWQESRDTPAEKLAIETLTLDFERGETGFSAAQTKRYAEGLGLIERRTRSSDGEIVSADQLKPNVRGGWDARLKVIECLEDRERCEIAASAYQSAVLAANIKLDQQELAEHRNSADARTSG